MGRLAFRTPGFAPRLLAWLALISQSWSICQLWHLLSPLGGEQVNYYPTSELKGLFLFRYIKGQSLWWKGTESGRVEVTAGCLCCGSEAADRSRREGGLGWQQMAAAPVGGRYADCRWLLRLLCWIQRASFVCVLVKWNRLWQGRLRACWWTRYVGSTSSNLKMWN